MYVEGMTLSQMEQWLKNLFAGVGLDEPERIRQGRWVWTYHCTIGESEPIEVQLISPTAKKTGTPLTHDADCVQVRRDNQNLVFTYQYRDRADTLPVGRLGYILREDDVCSPTPQKSSETVLSPSFVAHRYEVDDWKGEYQARFEPGTLRACLVAAVTCVCRVTMTPAVLKAKKNEELRVRVFQRSDKKLCKSADVHFGSEAVKEMFLEWQRIRSPPADFEHPGDKLEHNAIWHLFKSLEATTGANVCGVRWFDKHESTDCVLLHGDHKDDAVLKGYVPNPRFTEEAAYPVQVKTFGGVTGSDRDAIWSAELLEKYPATERKPAMYLKRTPPTFRRCKNHRNRS